MTQNQIHELFVNNFSQFIIGEIREWFPNGKNSIRVRMGDNRDYVFTYNDPNSWCFETVENFITRLRGRTKM